MRVNREGQVTIPQKVRKSMGIVPAETEVDFFQDEQGRWYLSKTEPGKKTSRFRTASERKTNHEYR